MFPSFIALYKASHNDKHQQSLEKTENCLPRFILPAFVTPGEIILTSYLVVHSLAIICHLSNVTLNTFPLSPKGLVSAS